MIKIYRCAYIYNETPGAKVRFSGWVRPEGMADVKHNILTVRIPANGEGDAGIPPTILGWEEMSLEADEIE